MNKLPKLLICDLDNTLYDWVGFFVPSFYAMIDKVIEKTNWDREELLDSLRDVHRDNHDTEHPFALLDSKIVTNNYAHLNRQDLASEFDDALHAFNSCRKKTLCAYDGVHETLNWLQKNNVKLVALTEGRYHSIAVRLEKLKLLPYFEQIYCREKADSVHPNPPSALSWEERFPEGTMVEVHSSANKPDKQLLLNICNHYTFSLDEVVYVGDSINRDILMASDAGIVSIWAKYGTQHDKELYEKLVRISHWTKEDVAREKLLTAKADHIRPNFTINSFSEIIDCLHQNVTS